MLRIILALSLICTPLLWARSGSLEMTLENGRRLSRMGSDVFAVHSLAGVQEVASVEHQGYEFSLYSHYKIKDELGQVLAEAYQQPSFLPVDFLFGRGMMIQDHSNGDSFVIKRSSGALRRSPVFTVLDSKKNRIGSLTKLPDEPVYVFSDASDEPQGEIEIYSDRIEVRYASVEISKLLVGFAALRVRQLWVNKIQKGTVLGILGTLAGYQFYKRMRARRSAPLPPALGIEIESPGKEGVVPSKDDDVRHPVSRSIEEKSPSKSFSLASEIQNPSPQPRFQAPPRVIPPPDDTIKLGQFVGHVLAKTVHDVVAQRVSSPTVPRVIVPPVERPQPAQEIRIEPPTPPPALSPIVTASQSDLEPPSGSETHLKLQTETKETEEDNVSAVDHAVSSTYFPSGRSLFGGTGGSPAWPKTPTSATDFHLSPVRSTSSSVPGSPFPPIRSVSQDTLYPDSDDHSSMTLPPPYSTGSLRDFSSLRFQQTTSNNLTPPWSSRVLMPGGTGGTSFYKPRPLPGLARSSHRAFYDLDSSQEYGEDPATPANSANTSPLLNSGTFSGIKESASEISGRNLWEQSQRSVERLNALTSPLPPPRRLGTGLHVNHSSGSFGASFNMTETLSGRASSRPSSRTNSPNPFTRSIHGTPGRQSRMLRR